MNDLTKFYWETSNGPCRIDPLTVYCIKSWTNKSKWILYIILSHLYSRLLIYFMWTCSINKQFYFTLWQTFISLLFFFFLICYLELRECAATWFLLFQLIKLYNNFLITSESHFSKSTHFILKAYLGSHLLNELISQKKEKIEIKTVNYI